MKKSSIIFSIFISFLFLAINTKKCRNRELNTEQYTEKTDNPQTKESGNKLKYNLSNKKIDYSIDGDKITLNFDGVTNQAKFREPLNEFKVIYIVKFYDKEKLGVDSIQGVIEFEKPLSHSAKVILQDEITEKMSWEVDIEKNDEKDQVVQLVAEASSKDGTERFMYDSFIFHYDSSDNKKFIFWLIYGGMMGIVLLTYCAMHIYIFFKGEDSRPSLKVNDVSAVQNEEERETFNSGTTS